jgi:hypothetical protein
MTLTPSEIEAASRWARLWEIGEYSGEALVLLGCIGEFVAEYTSLYADEWRHAVGRRSLLALILGLGVGLFSLIKTNALSGQIIASLGDHVKEAGGKAQVASDISDAALAKSKQADSKADNVGQRAEVIENRLLVASSQIGKIEKDIIAQGPRAKLLSKIAPRLASTLARFAGQRIGLFVCGQQGLPEQETLDAWAVIANILGPDKVAGIIGAKWKQEPTNLNWATDCGAAKGLGLGVTIYVSKQAPKATMDAAIALGRGLSQVISPLVEKTPSIVDPQVSKLMVERGFQNRESPWVAPGADPGLITVVIGEHP